MHDILQPAATVMPAVDEDNEEQVLRDPSIDYAPTPDSPVDMPFLQDHTADAGPPNGNGPDARGAAPPYEEALRSLPRHSSPFNEINLNDPPSSPELPRQQRTSGFRSLLNAMNPNRPYSQANNLRHTHQRSDSENSAASSADSPRSTSRTSHRPSPSAGSFFRTLSRQRSIRTINSNHLTSPSVISLNSISSPLTHTALRTEFTYPRTGPTPEQFKLISSPDALARFGVPYGADAIAFAASTSRQDLQPPPPDFDAEASTSNLLPRTDESASEVTSAPPPTSEVTTPVRLDTETETFARTVLDVIPQSAVATVDGHAEEAPDADSDSPVVDRSKSVSSRLSLPPASFRSPTEFGVRSESRVSSYSKLSYATAAESIVAAAEPDTSPNLGNGQHDSDSL
jgi:hypothetical protein